MITIYLQDSHPTHHAGRDNLIQQLCAASIRITDDKIECDLVDVLLEQSKEYQNLFFLVIKEKSRTRHYILHLNGNLWFAYKGQFYSSLGSTGYTPPNSGASPSEEVLPRNQRNKCS